MRDLTQACYLSEHGLPGEALTRYGHLFEAAIGVNSLRAAQHLGAYARILRKAGQPQRAKELCEQLLAQLTPADHAFTMLTFGARFELPLSLLALGEHARAAQLLDALLREHEAHQNPLLHGLTHGARAELALAMDDRQCFEHHLALMRSWLRDTKHPALYAQYQRLAERGRKLAQAAREGTPTLPAPRPSAPAGELQSFEQETPLSLLLRAVRDAGARAGYVYLSHTDGALERIYATQEESPPAACEAELEARLKDLGNDAFETELVESPLAGAVPSSELMTLVEDVAGTPLHGHWPGQHGYWFALSGGSDSTSCAGALLLCEGEEPLKRTRKLLLQQLAATLAR